MIAFQSEFDIDEIVDDDSPLSRSVSELKVKKKKKDNRKVVSDLEPDYVQKRKGGKEKKVLNALIPTFDVVSL